MVNDPAKPVHVAIDFDGTMHEYWGWPGHDELSKPIGNVLTWIKVLVGSGGVYSVFSARASNATRKKAIRDWLINWGFPKPVHITNKKMGEFDWIVDDKAIPMDDPRFWDTPFRFNRKAWWKPIAELLYAVP